MAEVSSSLVSIPFRAEEIIRYESGVSDSPITQIIPQIEKTLKVEVPTPNSREINKLYRPILGLKRYVQEMSSIIQGKARTINSEKLVTRLSGASVL